MRGARAKEIVSGLTRSGVDAGRGEQRRQPGRAPVRQQRAARCRAMARFSPSSGTTSAMEPMAARSASPSANARPVRRVRQQQLGDLEGDARTRQAGVRIAAVGAMGVDHRRRLAAGHRGSW